MRILVACEFSGTVRNAFRAVGHEAWSCDLLPSEDNSPYHVQGDARALLLEDWDLLIAHPPCTRLCNSGVRWLHERDLWEDMERGADLFIDFYDSRIPHICIENPVMHIHARRIIDAQPTQCVQPWQFGHGETKRTCFWLRNLPPLVPTNIVDGRETRVHSMSPSVDRWKERSRFFSGMADAMVQQWLPYIEQRKGL